MDMFVVSYVLADGTKGTYQIGAHDHLQAQRFTAVQLNDDGEVGYRIVKAVRQD